MTTPTFTNLWPTQLMEIILPGHDQANSILADHIEKLDIQRAQMTTDYLGDNLFDDQHPVVQWLNQSVQRAVLDYSQNLGIDYSLDFAMQAWANVNRMGDYHNLHNHPHAWLSGTYYVLIPEHDTLPSGRDDRTPNCISFFDPRPQANMTAIRGDGEVDPEHRSERHREDHTGESPDRAEEKDGEQDGDRVERGAVAEHDGQLQLAEALAHPRHLGLDGGERDAGRRHRLSLIHI